MGVCCVKQNKQEPAEFIGKPAKPDLTDLYKDKDTEEKIVKIQCAFRRHSAVKRVKAMKDVQAVNERAPKPESTPDQNNNPSENPIVREMEEKFGPFQREDPENDHVERVVRPQAILDNGARYTGQWFNINIEYFL